MKINTHLNLLSIILITISFYINIKCIDNATLNNCETGQYYNTVSYECQNKSNNSTELEYDYNTLKYTCAYGFYNNSNKCVRCPDYKVSSGDRQTYVECADKNGVYSRNKYGNYTIEYNNENITIYTCGCENIKNENLSNVYVQIEKDKFGNDLQYQYCSISFGLNASKNFKIEDTINKKVILQSDIIKNNGKLSLKQSNTMINCVSTYRLYNNDICIPNRLNDSFYSNFNSIPINNLLYSDLLSNPYKRGNYENRPTRDSDIVSYIKRPSDGEYTIDSFNLNINIEDFSNFLLQQNEKYNESLRNYCALALYSQSFPYCEQYNLFENAEENFLCNPDNVTFPVIVGKINNPEVETDSLNFYFRKWDKSGEYKGEVAKNELILCSETYNDAQDFKKVGATLVNECFMDLNKLLEEDMYFYEMYLKPTNEEEDDIPIYAIIDNENEQRNKILDDNNCNEFILRRRFFLFNNLDPNKLIYAKTIKLKVRFQNREHRKDNRIYPPYLRIEYFSHNNEINEPIIVSF